MCCPISIKIIDLIFLKVSRVILFIAPDGWNQMTNIEVRVGAANGTFLKDNSICGALYPGPAAANVNLLLIFTCQNVVGRFVTVQRTDPGVFLSIAHVKIDTGSVEGQYNFCLEF